MRNDLLERKVTRILPLGDHGGLEYKLLVTPMDERLNLVQIVKGKDHGTWEIIDGRFLGANGTEAVLDQMNLQNLKPGPRTDLLNAAADLDECEQCGRYLRDCRC